MPDIKIEGYKEAVQVFVQLAEQMQKRIVRQVLRKSARPMVLAARNRAPKRTGRLRKSIRADRGTDGYCPGVRRLEER